MRRNAAAGHPLLAATAAVTWLLTRPSAERDAARESPSSATSPTAPAPLGRRPDAALAASGRSTRADAAASRGGAAAAGTGPSAAPAVAGKSSVRGRFHLK